MNDEWLRSPKKTAKKVRQQFANIIHRYIAGDLTLMQEIQSNAQSTAPVARMARESLGIVSVGIHAAPEPGLVSLEINTVTGPG